MSTDALGAAAMLPREFNFQEAFRQFEKRLRFFESQALEAWKRSCGEQTIERTIRGLDGSSRTVVTKRECFGEVRYLDAAMRIGREQFNAVLRMAKVWRDLLPNAAQGTPNPPSAPCALAMADLEDVAIQPVGTEIASSLDPMTCGDNLFDESLLATSKNDSETPVRARKLRRQRERELKRKLAKAKRRQGRQECLPH